MYQVHLLVLDVSIIGCIVCSMQLIPPSGKSHLLFFVVAAAIVEYDLNGLSEDLIYDKTQ